MIDLWLLKVDPQGEMIWETVLGGTKNDVAYSLLALDDGDYLVVGSTASYGSGIDDLWVLKTNSNGDILWNITVGGTKHDLGREIISTSDDGYVVIGETGSYGAGWNDVWLVKLDQDGSVSWNMTYGGSMNDIGKSVRETGDGFILAGISESFGSDLTQGYMIHVDLKGELVWEQTYGGASDDYLESVELLPGVGYIATGFTSSTGTGESDVWLFSTSSEGDLIDETFYGGSMRDRMYEIVPTSDDGYILVGFTWSFGSTGNGYLIKITMEEPGSEPEAEPEEITEPEPEETAPEPEEEPGGIPGFSMTAISIGLLLFAIVVSYMRRH